MKTKIVTVILALVVMTLSGCVPPMSHGSRINPDDVAKIKKGVTTRAEIESMFGPATSVGMGLNGSRILVYYHTESPGFFLYNPFIYNKDRRQQLQVNIVNDVVEDYEFSDNTGNTSGSVFGVTSTTAPTK